MNLDERLRHAAEDIRAAAADTPVPSLDHETVHHGPQALRVGVIAAAGILAMGGLAVVYNESSSSPDRTTATQPATIVDRFIVDGMNVDEATQHSDGRSSEIWLNTPSDDSESALPAISITTGRALFPDLTDWQQAGRSIDVLGQNVQVRTLNGDPLGITWTTSAGLGVTLVAEGLGLNEFETIVGRLRPMTESEWREIAQNGPLATDVPTSTQTTDEIAEARGRWERAALPGYYLNMDGKIDTVGAHVELLVDGERVTSLDGSPEHEALTVNGLFDLLERVGNTDDDAVVSFHESLGYPTRIRVETDSVDLDLTVRELERFERPQGCASEPGSPTDLDAEPAEWLLYGQYTRWSDTAGCPVRIDVISQIDGPEHCDWQGADFLTVGRPIGTPVEDDRRADTYVWDPDDRLADADDVDRGQHIDARDLPSTAVDTGYRLDGIELWLDDQNRDVAYRIEGSNVEVLVRDATHRLLCL